VSGYSLENQKKLWDLHNSLLEDLLSSFPNEEISSLEELRKAVFFNLFQNNSTSFQTHTEVLFSTVQDNIQPRHFNKLPLSRVTEHLQNLLSIYLSEDIELGTTSYDMIHHADSDIASFYRNKLKPLLEVLDDNFDLGFEIPGNIQGTDVLDRKQVVKLYDDLHTFAQITRLKINDIKILDNEKLIDALEPLIQELYTVELGGMYAAVPGTEGMRPAVNVAVALHDSLDELSENMDKVEMKMLAKKFEFFALDDAQHQKVLLSQYTGKEKEFLKDKIVSFLQDFTDQSNSYLKGKGGFVGNFAYDRPTYFDRGTGIRTQFREMFTKEIIETGLVDIDILVRNSPEPISLLTSLDDAHRAFQIDINFPPYVSGAVINRLNEIVGLSTEGSVQVERIYRPGYEGMTIGEVLAETLRYPQRPDFQDIDPVIKKLNKYEEPIGKYGKGYLTATEQEGVSQLDDDIVTYHSRPNSQGELPPDINFHTGTYQAALDRASFKYEGKHMYEMLGETFNELNELINGELENFTLGESNEISVTADFGTSNNSSTLSAEITWDADNEELRIALFDEEGYLDGRGWGEYSEGFDTTGYSSEGTVAELVGEIRMQDAADIDDVMSRMPISPGGEFDFAKGYSLYEVTIPKDTKILSLDQPIVVEQRGKEVRLTADALQDIVEKGFNQPTSSTVYQDIDAITIGNNRLEISPGLSKNEIQELLFGEYDVIAYTNDIEDVGSISYIVKPNAATVRLIKGQKNNLFNSRVLREYISGNPFMLKGSFFDNDRTIRNIVNSITDKGRRYTVNTILEYFNKSLSGREITPSEQGNYDRLFYDVLYSEEVQRQDLKVPEKDLGKAFSVIDVNNPIPVATLEIDGLLHARPTTRLGEILMNAPEELYIQSPEGLVRATTLNILKLGGKNDINIFTYEGADAKTAYDYLQKNAGVFYKDDVAQDQVEFRIKKMANFVDDVPTNVVDEVEDAIIKSDGLDSLNKSKEIINKNPRIFSKVLSVLEKFDVGDQVIQQVIKRALPRIGMSAATGPAALAYAAYETSLLLADAINSVYKAETTSEGFWDNFGEISDKYSIAYKITKPTYDLLLDAIKVDLEDDNTLYSFSR
jgi:hypothetical protein